MRPLLRLALFVFAIISTLPTLRAQDAWIHEQAQPGDFTLAAEGTTPAIVYSESDYKVVSIAAHDLASDIERVSGIHTDVVTQRPSQADRLVVVGTLGRSPLIDELVSSGKLDVAKLRGSWETFLIATVTSPWPDVRDALVIAGSDRRGTAFGVYELSQAIGVSPWHWWSDVPPAKKSALHVASGVRRFGPPSVQYRGIFINDEDWGLQPWAAKTFEPETGNLGPKTYQRVFELLLRLKANTLWPAMHACSTPFNAIPANAALADDYAIVMGSSHAEPMLRNNVGEWKAPHEDYNYVTHRDDVRAYWEQRVRENGKFENLYTLGMRGIHDSGIQGAKTDAERIQILEQVFADQRQMLTQHVNPEVERVPQIFCAYKEVLGLYRQGLKVPEDVTIVWPDDNFGYVRNFATPAERNRRGGFGVYYHISYLGAPLSYLWLCTTPPALIWEEMNKAYDFGARRVWIVNVGDIKPAELDTEFFLQLAWDIRRWNRNTFPHYLEWWAAREFGAQHADEIAQVMASYYALNFQRKPEHLQWWLPKETPRPSPFSTDEIAERLNAFQELVTQTDAIAAKLSPEQRDAFFELVAYPVRGSAAANERAFAIDSYETATRAGKSEEAAKWAQRAHDAARRLEAETRQFNETVAQGKWRHIMALEPADKQWASMRIAPAKLPPLPSAAAQGLNTPASSNPAAPSASSPSNPGRVIAAIEAENFEGKLFRGSVHWEVVPMVGRTGDGVAVFPSTQSRVPTSEVVERAPRLDYRVKFPEAGSYELTVYLLPTHAVDGSGELDFHVGVDGGAPERVVVAEKDGGPEWAQGVLNATRVAHTTITTPSDGEHFVCIYGSDTSVVIDKIVVHRGPLPQSYLGPEAK